jgi:hypothetical protein
MGFFSRFGKPSAVQPEVDGVWVNGAARLQALRQEATRHLQLGACVVLAHFPSTLDTVRDELGDLADGAQAATETELLSLLTNPRPGLLCVALAATLPVVPQPTGASEARVSVLVAERHPLRTRDEAVGTALAELGERCTLRFYLSLEDPILSDFAGDKLGPIMAALGHAPGDEINHPLVARAVANVQKKLAKAARSDLPAASPAAWLEQNLPPKFG